MSAPDSPGAGSRKKTNFVPFCLAADGAVWVGVVTETGTEAETEAVAVAETEAVGQGLGRPGPGGIRDG